MQKRKDELSDSAQKPLWTGNGEKVETNQASLAPKNSAKPRRRRPATEVMKIVASKTLDHEAMAKTFSKDEIEDMIDSWWDPRLFYDSYMYV